MNKPQFVRKLILANIALIVTIVLVASGIYYGFNTSSFSKILDNFNVSEGTIKGLSNSSGTNLKLNLPHEDNPLYLIQRDSGKINLYRYDLGNMPQEVYSQQEEIFRVPLEYKTQRDDNNNFYFIDRNENGFIIQRFDYNNRDSKEGSEIVYSTNQEINSIQISLDKNYIYILQRGENHPVGNEKRYNYSLLSMQIKDRNSVPEILGEFASNDFYYMWYLSSDEKLEERIHLRDAGLTKCLYYSSIRKWKKNKFSSQNCEIPDLALEDTKFSLRKVFVQPEGQRGKTTIETLEKKGVESQEESKTLDGLEESRKDNVEETDEPVNDIDNSADDTEPSLIFDYYYEVYTNELQEVKDSKGKKKIRSVEKVIHKGDLNRDYYLAYQDDSTLVFIVENKKSSIRKLFNFDLNNDYNLTEESIPLASDYKFIGFDNLRKETYVIFENEVPNISIYRRFEVFDHAAGEWKPFSLPPCENRGYDCEYYFI